MTTLFLISDIFGRTSALETIREKLSTTVSDISIIDPYQGIPPVFESEADAYAYFTTRVGLKKYQLTLTNRLTRPGPDIVLIGFSIGASAIWGISGQPFFRPIRKAFCFYGSQIRHQKDVFPQFEIDLFFPNYEPHFDVDTLIGSLQKKPGVACRKTDGGHGFMNELSPGFNPVVQAELLEYLKAWLS